MIWGNKEIDPAELDAVNLHTRMLAQYFQGGPHIRHREEGTDLLCAFSRPGVGVLNVDPSCAQLACCNPESTGFVGQGNLDDVFLRRFPAACGKGLFGCRRFIKARR